MRKKNLGVRSEKLEKQEPEASSSDIPVGNNMEGSLPEESSVRSVDSVVSDPKQDSTQSRLASLIKITPELMSRVTGYGESTCKKVLLDCYPNKDITEFINQQTSIFLRRIKSVLHNSSLYDALDNAMVGKKIKDPEQIRVFVELQKLNQLLNGGK